MLKIKEFHSELNAFEVYNLFKNQKNSILLDSSKEDKNLSKYSFIGINEFMIFETMQSKSYIDGKEVKGDPFNSLEDLINKQPGISKEININKVTNFDNRKVNK